MTKSNKYLLGFGICFIFLALFFNFNRGFIFSLQGDFYYNNNKLANAQKFYSEAIKLGYSNEKMEEKYINSLINSPLTIEAQKQLVEYAENYKNNSALREKVNYFLTSLHNKIMHNYPNNYIIRAPYNHQVVHWNFLPITYHIVAPNGLPNYFIDEIDNAFSTLEKETEHSLLFTKTDDKNANIIIKYVPLQAEKENNQKYVIAYTTPEINAETLEHAYINFHPVDMSGNMFSPNQIYNTALHEIIHALGVMGHSNKHENIMFSNKTSKIISEDIRRELSPADIYTLKLLYKMQPDITNRNANINYTYIPKIILGSDFEINSVKKLEAKSYIRNAPNLPSGYIDLAEGYLQDKEYFKAIKALEIAQNLSKTDEMNAIIYYNLAVCNLQVENYELAEFYVQKAIEIRDTEDCHFLLAQIYTNSQKDKQAIEEYQKLIKQSPHNIEYTIGLTNIYVLKRNYFAARKVLKSYIKNNPSDKNNARFQAYGIIGMFL